MSDQGAYVNELERAAQAILYAEAILIGAGAGMGVDSGLPDFRGGQGFWQAYPPYAKLGLDFVTLANPRWFRDDPTLAWGFYGHRLMLYRQTEPHGGFAILRRWMRAMPRGGFVYTSNVDGHFQRAGFSPQEVYEVHGTLGALQCLDDCGAGIFPADDCLLTIVPDTMRAVEPLPRCPKCGGLARPNVLMFGDWGWDPSRSDAQRRRLTTWLKSLDGARLVIIECGAGTAIPTVRLACQDAARRQGARLIRINVREPEIPSGHISLPMAALKALVALDQRVGEALRSGARDDGRQ
jgi:NAD-dependent SIR2 family protein deacetylase